MQKQAKKKLALGREVVRSMATMNLRVVQGAAQNPTVSICREGDECATIHTSTL